MDLFKLNFKLLAFLVFYLPAARATSQSWQALASTDFPRMESMSAVVDGKLYVFAGFTDEENTITDKTEVYDPATNQWSQRAAMPVPVTHVGAAVVGKKVWFAGGFEGNHPGPAVSLVQVYDTETDTWSTGPSLPAARGSNALVNLGGKLHCFGGLMPDRRTDAGDHYVLDPADPAAGWSQAAPLPEARNHLGAAVVNGKIYAMGGQHGHDGERTDVTDLHIYDPGSGQWTRGASLPVPRSHFEPGTIVYGNKIIITGGREESTRTTKAVSEYDAATNTWKDLVPLPQTLLAPVAKVIGSKLIVAGGASSQGPVSTVRAIDLSDDGPDVPTGEEEMFARAVSVYPNPAKDKVYLHWPGSRAKVRVFDCRGHQVGEMEINKSNGSETTVVSVAGWAPGLYIGKIISGNKEYTYKIMINP